MDPFRYKIPPCRANTLTHHEIFLRSTLEDGALEALQPISPKLCSLWFLSIYELQKSLHYQSKPLMISI